MLSALSTLQNCTVCMPSVVNSTDVPVCTAPPSIVKWVAATPESASDAAKVIVTSTLVQSGALVAVVVGAVRSILTDADVAVAEFPATSNAVAVVVTAPPSDVSTESGGHTAMCDS